MVSVTSLVAVSITDTVPPPRMSKMSSLVM